MSSEAAGGVAGAGLREAGGAMADSLIENKVFEEILEGQAPGVFLRVDPSKTFVVSRVAKDGYVPMLHVQVCMSFGPEGEPSLFAPDEV